MAGDGRSTSRYWVARGKFLSIARREHRTCARCGRAIDWQAPSRGAQGPSVDHITPIALGGALLDVANMQLMHFGCNASRGATLGVALSRLRRGNRVRRTRGRRNTGHALVPEAAPMSIGGDAPGNRGGWRCNDPSTCSTEDDGPHSVGVNADTVGRYHWEGPGAPPSLE